MRARQFWVRWLTFLLLCLLPGASRAQEQAQTLPPELKPWVPWVLEGLPERHCRKLADQTLCAWPGRLELEVSDQGGHFTLEVVLDAERDVVLPGSEEIWPQEVKVGGRQAVVLSGATGPSVHLPAGEHRLSGAFEWQSLPEGMPVDSSTGLVLLSVNGERIAAPKRDAGRVWLKRAAGKDGEGEALNLEVFRRLDDGVPLRITTRLLLRVSGRAREQNLGHVLLAGTVPLALTSELPVRLDPEQGLFVQLRPGTYRIEITARSEASPETLAPIVHGAPWPEREIWVWSPSPSLREVEVSGAPATDPTRTNLDQDWRTLAAYSLGQGDTLKLKTTRRGEATPPPNRLTLERTFWLDLDGRGWTVRDHFAGNLQRGFRLDLLQGTLGRAAVAGRDELVTLNPKTGRAGVELREATLRLVAESRLPMSRKLRAVGWSEDAQSLSGALNLPPGYRLLGARGVDSLDGAWLDSWDLFDFFFVLVVAIALSRLASPAWGALILVALVLCHGEDGAPRYVFATLLVAWALLLLVPQSWVRQGLRLVFWAAALTYVGLALTFSVSQVRKALYPQLGDEYGGSADFAMKEGGHGVGVMAEPLAAAPPPEADEGRGSFGSMSRSKKEDAPAPSRQLTQDPKAVIQTGPGIPNWSWQSSRLTWSGPVDQSHELTLYLLPPPLNTLLGFVRALLLVALGFVFFRGTPRGAEPPARLAKADKAKPLATAAAALLSCLALLSPSVAHAAPTPEILEELKTKLAPAPACGDACVSVARADLELQDNRLRIRLEAHAGAATSMPLPGPAASWVFERARVDGKETAGLALLSDGHVHVRLEPGRHQIELEGPIAGDELTLAFGRNPHRLSVRADRWDVEGLRGDGRIDGSLRLVRRLERDEAPAQNHVALPPWFEIERRLELGVTWRVLSTVRRISPPGTPVIVRFPLLGGERVQGDRPVENGSLVLALGRDETSATWESTLDLRDVLALRAPTKVPWTEVWILNCSVVFRCEPTGLAPVQQQADGRWQPTYRPWPGETLQVGVARPAAARGSSTTIDSVNYTLTPGVRLLRGKLALSLRSTTGGVQTIKLPEGAKLSALKVDGIERATRQDGREIAVALGMGGQSIEVEWQQPLGLQVLFRAPAVELGRESVNARVSIVLPDDRWLLFAGGPSWGPAILFWGYVIVVLGAALALSRLRRNPLTAAQWALLGIGLTQVPVAVAIAVAGWFFLIAFRETFRSERPLVHDALQLFIALATLVFVGLLVASVYRGLVVQPDMQVEGAGSSGQQLNWYVDRSTAALPQPWLLSLPLWVWQAMMLAWALWLALNLVRWLRWAWSSFSSGSLWLPLVYRANVPAPPPPAPPVEPPQA